MNTLTDGCILLMCVYCCRCQGGVRGVVGLATCWLHPQAMYGLPPSNEASLGIVKQGCWGLKAHSHTTVNTDRNPIVRSRRSFRPSVGPSPLSLRIRSAPGETEQYHWKSRRQYRVKSQTIRENRYSIISDMYIYIVFIVLYLYYTIYLTFLFYCSPALAMSSNWSFNNILRR